jgi:hypothetical protein
MPLNDSKTRSSEVQAVLNSSPQKSIVWGNVFIIGLLVAFFLSLSIYDVPMQTQLPFQLIYKSDNDKGKDQALKILITKPLDAKLITNLSIKLTYNYPGSIKPMVVLARLDQVAQIKDSIIFNASINGHNAVMIENAKQLKTGMIGITEATTGKISLLHLFGSKMISRL